MEPWYKFEATPIRTKDLPSGKTETQLCDLTGRVMDAYTNMPIGAVVYEGRDQALHAYLFFPELAGREVDKFEIEDKWGARADLAVEAIWGQYWKQFRWTERLPRYMWRYQKIGWLIAGTIIGAVAQLVLRNL